MAEADSAMNSSIGTSDFLPHQMVRRNAVFAIVRNLFERFGYLPIETPSLQPLEILDDAATQPHYRVANSDDNTVRATLPSDLTVPFARFVAAHYAQLPIPFKRYQIQRVWSAGNSGGEREYYQCDIDSIGSSDVVCEAEIGKIIAVVFAALNIPDITIGFNSRQVLRGVLSACGVKEHELSPVMRLINQTAKRGADAIIADLRARGVAAAERVMAALQKGDDNESTLQNLAELADVTRLRLFIRYCALLGVPPERLVLEPTLARELPYYTGIIFEVTADGENCGVICAGGRYDNLLARFSANRLSGVGVSFEVEKIIQLYEQRNGVADKSATTQVLVANRADAGDFLPLYRTLLDNGIATEVYLEAATLDKQFEFAHRKRIPFVVMVGTNEGETIVRRINNNREKVIPRRQLPSYIANYYEAEQN